jgi:translation initiation factor IF-3
MDYSKFSYEQQKKAREARKRQKTVEVKTIRMRVKTDDYHKDIYVNKARGWLEDGKKVQVTIRFYGRERDYPHLGRERLEGIAEDLKDVSSVEQAPKMEGWTMNMMLAPEAS